MPSERAPSTPSADDLRNGRGDEGTPGDAGAGDARGRLAGVQAALVAALVAGAEAPGGFDADRLRIQAASLVAKRRSVVARLRPDAAAAAGSELAADFARYAAERTTPPPGYRADADDFAAWLRARGKMPEPPDRRWFAPLLRWLKTS
ncbi:hypothetical protein OIE66_02055 [Nonomuraea sp. NBC_01738]|uniref:hypothetical protein n=1 Tax=Nonomuraea sp. NBC_01738 TaxID=2976003 RepID=UPI002E166200|nr:hypothetical protein OIE66_02055 [Nonomuraea sp. NBC_01738]